MRYQALMVRRFDEADADAVAGVFADHDATGLPARLGVAQRTLFHYQGLYFHLVQSDVEFLPRLYDARNDALIQDIDAKLRGYLRPYRKNEPAMAQSQATSFYQWHA
ncbi:polyketide synthase [Paractinoplanes tereljensis]|uniref:Polyketide synthase n=2 Tax=Paractinoplanes tereljensis TaxID=571912 RepID=A0A919NFR9_9ACTN|nr:polyketide synthase [Actinoplanes tereljensis]